MKNFKEYFSKVFEVNGICAEEKEIKKTLELHKLCLLKKDRLPTVLNLNKNYEGLKILTKVTCSHIVLVNKPVDESIRIQLETNYDFYNAHELLSTFLVNPPTSFETVGNVVHLNLREEFLTFKYLIGKIIHDKTSSIVINKLNNINNTFRYFEFEIIGDKWLDFNYLNDKKPSLYEYNGFRYEIIYDLPTFINCKEIRNDFDEDEFYELRSTKEIVELVHSFIRSNSIKNITIDKLETIHIENGIKFLIDLKNCYWCSKLQSERQKLLNLLKEGEVFCDIFCGVGPMALPALKKGCKVFCNDLNTTAITCLKKSLHLNKLNNNNLKVSNADAGEFLISLKNEKIDHFFLNLPEHSLEYLKYLNDFKCNFKVHCYFFCNENVNIIDYVFKKTTLHFTSDNFSFVRKVSPSKNMYKLYFRSCDKDK